MEKDRKNTKQKILEAAEAEFLEKGYNGATTAGIAARAKVTHAMLHYYFQTKENLFGTFVKENLVLIRKAVFPENGISPESDVEQIIRFIVGHHMDFIMSHPELVKFMMRDMLFDKERQQAFYSVVMQDEGIMEMAGMLYGKVEREGLRTGYDFRSMMIDMALFNISSLISLRISGGLFHVHGPDEEAEVLERKEENVRLIMDRFRR